MTIGYCPTTQVARTGEWNAMLMARSFDAIIHETTLFDGGVTGGSEQLVLVRGYPGPLGVPFAKIPTDQPGANRAVSDCHFTKTSTEYDRKPGIKWLSCTEK